MTRAFEKLKVACEGPEKTKAHWRDWMSNSTWAMIKQCTLLRRAGQLRRAEGQRMQQAIHAALKRNYAARTAQVGKLIVAELAKGNVHEAFWHLKGWYRNASETHAEPCFHIVARLTCPPHHHRQCQDAYQRIRDDPPTDGEIRVAVAKLTNGRSAGVSQMQAEHLEEWLKGAQLEEDPEKGANNVGAG